LLDTLLALSELYIDLKNGKCMLYETKTQMVPLRVLDSHTEIKEIFIIAIQKSSTGKAFLQISLQPSNVPVTEQQVLFEEFCNDYTYLFIPWSRVLLEELIGSQLVEKFLTFFNTRRLITTFTSARHRFLS
jgi:hypothetical protein